MKNIFISLMSLTVVTGLVSCTAGKKATTTTQAAEKNEMTVTGEIIKIENGKDGYMATVNDKSGKSYIVTISIVNLHKSGSNYKRFEVGDKIRATGAFTTSYSSLTYYITAKEVKQVR